MGTVVADTSGLVSLGIAAGDDPDPLADCLDEYNVVVPSIVFDELQEIADFEDAHGRAAAAVVDSDATERRHADLDEEFPLDDGENAAVTLANEIDADLFLCDEFNSLGLIHASLSNTRLVTTPTLLSVLVRRGRLSTAEAASALETISRARSWESNSYVTRARALFDD
ncbi:hypothetical protein [Halapricum salinum]|uniref:DUF3368 domain-containing protein n=1 Tax=Halapricum salinum TaxID=1457250 RepID=A0A4D6HDE8_9EURY|nr:hypothetical protein [Halapricum salinum]QCC51615.1 hypothetical protein DV733_10355 [Halapricum salinum]